MVNCSECQKISMCFINPQINLNPNFNFHNNKSVSGNIDQLQKHY